MHFCVYCNKDTKMEMMNEAHGSADKQWLRCSRCHHMSMSDNSAKLSGKEALKMVKLLPTT